MKRNILFLLALLPTIVFAQYSNQIKANTKYTNSNPMYRYGYWSVGSTKHVIDEDYYIGRTDAYGKFNGWCQWRNFREKSVMEYIGYFRDNQLYTGYYFQYYSDEPEVTGYSYFENGEFKRTWKVKQGELFATKKAIEDYGRRNEGVTPLSQSYGSKFYNYSGRMSDSYGYDQKAATAKSSSSVGAMTGLAALAAIGAAIWGVAKSIDDAEAKAYDNKQRKAAQESNRSMSNVEIVDWWTLGSLAISHAKVQLRNKNNYDVNVTVGLYQGKWSDGKIIYNGSEQSDYISGVSDNYSTTIRVKANSIRTVYLKADSRGRPTNIRISSVR